MSLFVAQSDIASRVAPRLSSRLLMLVSLLPQDLEAKWKHQLPLIYNTAYISPFAIENSTDISDDLVRYNGRRSIKRTLNCIQVYV